MKKTLLICIVLIFSVTSVFSADRPTVAVVLSGGGAKGIAHIALLERLEELGIPIDMVLGTSMGSLIGGLYCAGYSPQDIRNLISENDLTELFTSIESSGYKRLVEPFDYHYNTLSISLGSGIVGISGVIDDYKIMNFFYNAIGNIPKDIDFDDLPTPFRCIGTNAVTGQAKIFEEGDLIDSMRASMSIPLVFSPKKVDGELYVDGGLVDNMPIDTARKMGYDIIIAEDVNAKFDITQKDYDSISGSLGALFRVIVNNTIRDQKSHADLMLEPDLRGIGTLSFGEPDEIIKRGTDEVELKNSELEKIAAVFSENQKVYKNPKRIGMYFTKYVDAVQRVAKSSAEKKTEDALHQTRIAFIPNINGGLAYDFMDRGTGLVANLNPSFGIQLFIKKIGNSRFSADTKLTIGKPIKLSQNFMVRIAERDNGERSYLVFGAEGEMGTESAITDTALKSISWNRSEFRYDGKFGVKITDERTHNIDISANASGYAARMKVTCGDSREMEGKGDLPLRHYFYPFGELSAIWYGKGAAVDSMDKSLRLDFKGDAGYFYNKFTYKMALGAEKEWDVGKNNGIWFDFIAHTTREPIPLANSYIQPYGGWGGVPGYTTKHYYSDFVTAGFGWDKLIKKGLITTTFILQVRGGIRSKENRYEYYYFMPVEYVNNMPFSEMATNMHWDLGIGAGLSFESALGGFVVGAGFNKDLKLALYVQSI